MTQLGIPHRIPAVCLVALLVLGCAGSSTLPVAPRPVEPPLAAPTDTDGDGVTDASDSCRCGPEDLDGHADEDGCADPDDDGDHIPDVCDYCPNQAEVYNEHDDEDGCPDYGLVRISDASIVVVQAIRFARGSTEIDPDAIAIIRETADVLRTNPQIVRLRIIGHTDDRERGSVALGLQRAEAVRDALVALGIASDRLLTESAGATRPISGGSSDADRARNRRIEFMIEEIDDALVPAAPSPAPAPTELHCPEDLPPIDPPCP